MHVATRPAIAGQVGLKIAIKFMQHLGLELMTSHASIINLSLNHARVAARLIGILLMCGEGGGWVYDVFGRSDILCFPTVMQRLVLHSCSDRLNHVHIHVAAELLDD
jgi:hypothetical protein